MQRFREKRFIPTPLFQSAKCDVVILWGGLLLVSSDTCSCNLLSGPFGCHWPCWLFWILVKVGGLVRFWVGKVGFVMGLRFK